MGLASRIGTYMGPFQGFGPNWDQVPNLGHHYKHCYLDFFFSETKFSETETETFFRGQIFSKPKPILFFRNRNRDQIFSKPKPRLFFRNRNRNPERFRKSFETEKFRNRNVDLWLIAMLIALLMVILMVMLMLTVMLILVLIFTFRFMLLMLIIFMLFMCFINLNILIVDGQTYTEKSF